MRIDQNFNTPVVQNFDNRQTELADQLDNVRMEMYEVKLSSKTLKLIY